MKRAAETGCVEEAATTPARVMATYASFVSDTFEQLYLPRYRPATARRYRELHAQRVLSFFGDKPLDAIGPGDFRAFAAAALEVRLRAAVKDKLPRARVVLDEKGRTPRR